MSDAPNQEIIVFNEALQLPVTERGDYLDRACSGDAELRRRVDILLRAHVQAGDFLEEPPTAIPSWRDSGRASASSMASVLSIAEQPGDRIGRYKLLQQIGEGGCGVVYMAEQEEPVRRRVALKVIKLGMDTKNVIARFEAERQALALMDHPNIARVLDAGATDTGRPFFVMELVRGSKITDYCDQNDLSIRERLDLFIFVCRAVQHAHQKGVIHRDIKPSNILITVNDGSPVPKVIDFGIAKATQGRLIDQTFFTAFEQFIGTPAYMSPEQSILTSVDIDTRTDIYSLGVLLYELLTGQPPFPQKELLATGLEEMRRIIREKEPMRPSTRLSQAAKAMAPGPPGRREPKQLERLIPLLQGDLDWIVMKCLEKDRARRYDTANGLAMELQRFLANEPVVARPPSRLYLLQKLFRRHKLFFVTGGAVLAALVTGLALSTWQYQAKSRAEREQNSMRVRAEAAERRVREQLYTALLEQARATVRSGELGQRVRTLDAVQRAGTISNSVALRQVAVAAMALPDMRLEREISFVQDEGGRECDPALERYAVCVNKGSVEVRAIVDNHLLANLPPVSDHLGHVKRWSHDGRYLAIKRDLVATGDRGDVEVWDMVSIRRVLDLRDCATDAAVAFHPAGRHFAVGQLDGGVRVWDLETGREVRQIRLPGTLASLSFSPDGTLLAAPCSQSASNMVGFVNWDTGELKAVLPSASPVVQVAWRPGQSRVAIPDLDSNVRLVDPTTGESKTLGRHKAEAVHVAFSPDGAYLISGGWERELICWEMTTLQRAFTMGLNSERVQFSRNGRKCAVHTTDRLQIYEFVEPSACRELSADLGQSVFFGRFSPDGQWFAAGGSKFIGVWDLTSPGSAALLPSDTVRFPFFSTDASDIYAHGSGALQRWHLRRGEGAEPPVLTAQAMAVPDEVLQATALSNELVMFCPDGVRFMPLGNTNVASIRHLEMPGIASLASPDERWLGVMYRWSPALSMLRLPEVTLAATLTNRANVGGFSFSPNGEELVVVTERGLECYETVHWQRTRELPIRCEAFARVHFMPDGQRFWLNSDGRNSTFRDARSFEVLLSLPEGTMVLGISPNGRHLAVSVDLRRVQLWDLERVEEHLRALGVPTPRR